MVLMLLGTRLHSIMFMICLYVSFLVQFIALGTFDGTIKLLDHTGTFLRDRDYNVVSGKQYNV